MASSPSPEEAAMLAQILQLTNDAQTTNYMAGMCCVSLPSQKLIPRKVAALTVLIFDYFLTLDREIELIWKRPKQIVANIFLLLEMASTVVVIPAVDLVLLLRVWVLYGKSKKVLYCFLPAILAESILLIVLDYKVVKAIQDIGFIHLGPFLKGCYSFRNPERATYSAMAYPPLAIVSISVFLVNDNGSYHIHGKSTAMFLLTAYKCGSRLYEERRRDVRIRTHILSLFLRDGIYWFVAVLALFATQITMASIDRVTLGTVMINPCLVGYSVISSRILLNMREISVVRDAKGIEGSESSGVRHPLNFTGS
ncbi:hypothetical protein VNI00_011428 [Paramarasmius palmivorus]|uniref:DUF6533 domain-containing protein n=1 Tax=Paramarasmius palmivorus TaxID=297713 RepID=A0AAW0CD43_9AGAR